MVRRTPHWPAWLPKIGWESRRLAKNGTAARYAATFWCSLLQVKVLVSLHGQVEPGAAFNLLLPVRGVLDRGCCTSNRRQGFCCYCNEKSNRGPPCVTLQANIRSVCHRTLQCTNTHLRPSAYPDSLWFLEAWPKSSMSLSV